jgi:hypothetical protein
MPNPAFEDAPYPVPPDETDVNLRAYFDSISESKLERLDPNWDDEELRAWDGNFRIDGSLMMVCCDRDVGIEEYRQVLHEFLAFRRSAEQRCGAKEDGSREG